MKKNIGAALIVSLWLAACGGGGSSSTPPAAKSLSISMYGQPMVAAATASAHAQIVALDQASGPVAASAPTSASDAVGTTIQSLQDALTALGVPVTVTPQVMDGTTLHQIVMGEDNGLPPTPDQFKTDPSEWLVVNFQLDDMVTSFDDPAQAAAVAQFAQDLTVFAQRAAVSGKKVLAVMPIMTCDLPAPSTAAYGLQTALDQATVNSTLSEVGPLPNSDLTPDHLGADCRTPDAFLQNAHVQAVANDIANRYKLETASTQ